MIVKVSGQIWLCSDGSQFLEHAEANYHELSSGVRKLIAESKVLAGAAANCYTADELVDFINEQGAAIAALLRSLE